MQMMPNDSFKLFAMKVQEAAEQAYSSDNRECARKMQECFVKAVPKWFQSKLQQRQEMKEMMGLGSKLCWNDIVKQAERIDKEIRNKRWNVESNVVDRTEHTDAYTACMALQTDGDKKTTTKVYSNQHRPGRYSASPSDDSPRHRKSYERRMDQTGPNKRDTSEFGNFDKSNQLRCYHCGRPGHIQKRCWKKSGACLICGSFEHMRRDCTRYQRQTYTSAPHCRGGVAAYGSSQSGAISKEAPALN
jgi:hypothetical protein